MKKILNFIVKKRVMMGFIFGGLYIYFFKKGNNIFFYFGIFIIVLGEFFRLWAASQLRKIEVLATDGIYSVTRNPLYFGSFLIGNGFILMIFNLEKIFYNLLFLTSYFLIFFYIYIKTINNEENSLFEKFGMYYTEYKKTTTKFFPGKLPKNLGEISLKRIILNKEYKTISGILLIILILYVK